MEFKWKFDQQFELKILNLFFNDQFFLANYIDIIDPVYFSNRIYQNLANIAKKYFLEYLKPITKTVLANELSFLISLKELPKELYIDTIKQIYSTRIEEKEYIYSEIAKWCEWVEINLKLAQARDILETKNPDISKVRSLVANSSIIKTNSGIEHSKEVEERIYFRKLSKYENRIPTLITGVDRILRGGVSKKELLIIGAAPNVGKTAILVNCTFGGLYDSKSVLYLSCELDEERIAERTEQRICLMTDDEIINNRKEATKRINKFYKLSKSRLFIKSVGSGEWGIDNLRTYLQQLKIKENFVPDLIIIDYLDELKSNYGYDKFYASETAITAGLINIAKEFDVPLITATQASREAVGKQIVTEKEIAQCFQKVRKADVILTICQTKEEEEENIARIYIAKNRNNPGKHMQIPINIDFSRMHIKDLED